MSEPPALLAPDQAQVYTAILLLQPCTEGRLVSRLHLPVNAISHSLRTLQERGLVSVVGSRPAVYSLTQVVAAIYPYIEILLLPILEENRLLRSQRDADLEYQARQLNRIRTSEAALTAIAQHESEEGQLASTTLHSINPEPKPCSL